MDSARLLAERRFPVYGLDGGWTGRRWFGGSGGSGDAIDRLELGHGDPYDAEAPVLRVASLASPPRERDYKEWLAAKSLAEHLWHEGGVDPV